MTVRLPHPAIENQEIQQNFEAIEEFLNAPKLYVPDSELTRATVSPEAEYEIYSLGSNAKATIPTTGDYDLSVFAVPVIAGGGTQQVRLQPGTSTLSALGFSGVGTFALMKETYSPLYHKIRVKNLASGTVIEPLGANSGKKVSITWWCIQLWIEQVL